MFGCCKCFKSSIVNYFIFIIFIFVSFVFFGCGRAWKGSIIVEEQMKIFPKESEITRLNLPQSVPEGVQWDFTLDNEDVPYISIFDELSGRLLYYTIDDGGEWKENKVDPPEGDFGYIAGKSPNIFFVNDRVHIVYLSSSRKDKIPRMRFIKEAFLDSLGIWRCRIVMRSQEQEFKFVKALFSPVSGKILAVFLDNNEGALSLVAFSPAQEEDTPFCGQDEPEEPENEQKVNVIFLGNIHYFGQGEVRLKNKLDRRCNPMERARTPSPAGFSIQLINFQRGVQDMTGFISYDPILDYSFWIELFQDDINQYIKSEENQKSDENIYQVSLTVNSQNEISVLGFNAGQECLPASARGIYYNLEIPVKDQGKIIEANLSFQDGSTQPIKAIVVSPTVVFFDLTDVNIPFFPFRVIMKYKGMPKFKFVSIGKSIRFPSCAADKEGRVHFAGFNATPPLLAAEYGFIEPKSFNIRTSIIEGGGGGIYTQGTGGTAIAVTDDGYPIVIYFAPFEQDMKVAVRLQNTWLVAKKSTESSTGLSPKALITSDKSYVAVLVPTITPDKIKFSLIYVPITL